MTSKIVSIDCGGPGFKTPKNLRSVKRIHVNNKKNERSPRDCYQWVLENINADILLMVHDDVTIHDMHWHDSIMSCFQDQTENYTDTVAVGFGGATKLGHPNLYKRPYRLPDMARSGYASNQIDAETHGERFTGVRQVAVLDAFIMAVRRDFLVSVGGWPEQLSHHGLDLWLACMAARHGKQIYMTGVDCNHLGGRTSTKGIYADATWLQGGTLDSDHQTPHRWLYDEFRDVLPIDVTKF